MSSPPTPARRLPAPDDRLVAADTRYEIEEGRTVYVSPADEPHGTRHSKLSALLEAHVRAEFDVASDMLTRLTEIDDQAPDASVFPRERDPETGGRRLEVLAFEVVSTERLARAASKAAKLSARGVRRIFAIDVVRERVLEWSTEMGTWSPLADSAAIDDPALALALPVAALVRTTQTDDAVARALLTKRNAVLVEAENQAAARGEARGEVRGAVRGAAEALLALLDARGLPCPEDLRARILACRDLPTLTRWVARAVTATRAVDVVD